jgi:hypothetical protein
LDLTAAGEPATLTNNLNNNSQNSNTLAGSPLE